MFPGHLIFIVKAKRFTSFLLSRVVSTSSPWSSESFNARFGVLNPKMGTEGDAFVLWWDVCESGLPVILFIESNS